MVETFTTVNLDSLIPDYYFTLEKCTELNNNM